MRPFCPERRLLTRARLPGASRVSGTAAPMMRFKTVFVHVTRTGDPSVDDPWPVLPSLAVATLDYARFLR